MVNSAEKKKLIVKYLISTLIVAAAIGFLKSFTSFDFRALADAFWNLNTTPLFISIVLALLQVGGQVARFNVLFEPHERIPFKKSAGFIVQSQLMNSVVPLRSGDAFKILRWYQFDKGRFELTRLTGIVFAERASDVSALILSGLFASTPFLLSMARDLRFTAVHAVAFGAVTVTGTAVGIRFRKEATNLIRPLFSLRFLYSFVCSLIAWLLEFFSLYFLIQAAGYDLKIHEVISVLLIVNLGIAIPVTVANVGVFEAAMSFALSQFHVPTSVGILIASMHHFLLLIALLVWFGALYETHKTARPH